MRLRAGSAAENAGQFIPNIDDGFGGPAPDIGAFEFGAAMPAYGPRTSVIHTYYVATNGSDTPGGGTSAAPWRTLQYAANRVLAGDTVIVRAGDYAGFYLETDGTASAPITFTAEPGARITSRNPTTADGINLEGADYIIVQGFVVDNTGGTITRAGFRSVTNTHVTFRNNSADRCGTWGILTGFSDDILIENNVLSRSGTQHGIYVGNSGDRPVIRNNTCWGNAGCGIHMNGDSSQGGDGIISGALVENNIIYDNGTPGGGSGINCDGVQNSRFQNNLLYNNHASGISLYRIDGGGPSTGNVVVNNTVLMAIDGRWALNIQNGSTGNQVYNNVLLNLHPTHGSIDIGSTSLPGFLSDYNIVMDRFTTNGGSTTLTLAQWRTNTGQDAHSRVATPAQVFVDPATNNYRPKAGGPAVDNGTAMQAPLRDLAATNRPQGAGFDIGAYEFITAVPPQIAAVQVNDGTAQRSRVTSLTVTFNAQVTFASTVASAFTLQRTGGGAVNFSATASVVNGGTVVTLNAFTGAETEFGSLRDGRYTLTALASQISAGGQALDGDGNGTGGDNYAFGEAQGLFRFFGDYNGDRHVDIADFGLFSSTFNLSVGQAGFLAAFDFNGDGHIDIADFGQFSLRFFTLLP
jgi:hypothetical protein